MLISKTCLPKIRYVIFKNEGPTNIEIKEINIDSHVAQLFAIKEKPYLSAENIVYSNGLSIKPGQTIFLELLVVIDYEGDIRASVFFEFAAKNIVIYPLLLRGIPNEYAIKPIYKPNLQIGRHYRMPIEMKNPFNFSFKIGEIKSSFEEDILRWPNGTVFNDKELEGITTDNYTIPPDNRKLLLNIHFAKEIDTNIYDVIKINTVKDTLAIPVLLQVTKPQVRIFPAAFNFGVISKQRRTLKAISISIFNETSQSVQVLSISTEFDDKLIDFIPNPSNEFYKEQKHTLKANSPSHNIGHVILDSTKGNLNNLLTKRGRRIKGVMIIRISSEHQNIIKVPYQYFIDENAVVHVPLKNFFKVNKESNVYNLHLNYKVERDFDATYKPQIDFPVNAKIKKDNSGVYDLNLSFKSVAIVERPFLFAFVKSEGLLDSIPVHFYDDSVLFRIDEIGWAVKFPYLVGGDHVQEINLGVFGQNQPSSRTLEITNKNPYKIIVSEFHIDNKDYQIRLREIVPMYYNEVSQKELLNNTIETNKELRNINRKASKSDIDKVYIKLLTGTKILLDVDIPTSKVGNQTVEVKIELGDSYIRNRKSSIKLILNSKVVKGGIHFSPSLVRFEPSFPGIIQKKKIMSKSTFDEPVKVKSVELEVSTIKADLLTEEISTKDRTELFDIIFDPSLLGNSVIY